MKDISFKKMNGLGNDFVIFDGITRSLSLNGGQVRHISDRQRGVGCDQLIILEKPVSSKADLFMRIYNPDGSESGACGNATRCVADIFIKQHATKSCQIETLSGVLGCTLADDGQICVDMGTPKLNWDEIPLSYQCDTLHLPLEGDPVGVSMGNPHCVYFCENALDIPVDKWGPERERHPLFPERTNVEYVSMHDIDHLRMRVWERGAGITQACGTGACAAAVAAIRRGLTSSRRVTVTLDGGDLLIEWHQSDAHVLMTGPVAYNFDGVISLA